MAVNVGLALHMSSHVHAYRYMSILNLGHCGRGSAVAVSPAANQFYNMHRDVAPDLYAPDPAPNSAPTSPHSAAEDACSDDENLELQEALNRSRAGEDEELPRPGRGSSSCVCEGDEPQRSLRGGATV